MDGLKVHQARDGPIVRQDRTEQYDEHDKDPGEALRAAEAIGKVFDGFRRASTKANHSGITIVVPDVVNRVGEKRDTSGNEDHRQLAGTLGKRARKAPDWSAMSLPIWNQPLRLLSNLPMESEPLAGHKIREGQLYRLVQHDDDGCGQQRAPRSRQERKPQQLE